MAEIFAFAPDRKALVTGGASGIGVGRGEGVARTSAQRSRSPTCPRAIDLMRASATKSVS